MAHAILSCAILRNEAEGEAMRDVDYLIIGGGPAGVAAAETLRFEGASGSVALLSADSAAPYRRPALSKGVLINQNGAQNVQLHDISFYDSNDINLFLSCRALAVDPVNRVVLTSSAGAMRYRKLLLATGSRARTLGAPGENLPGVFTLRTLADAVAIAAAVTAASENSGDAVVVGSSFIAMELAAAFVTRGLKTTLIAREQELYQKLCSRTFSVFIRDYFEARGVTLIFGDCVRCFNGDNRLDSVTTHNGLTISCELAAIGAGAEPELEFLKGSGLLVRNGVVTDEHLRASSPDIFAAGDIANFFDPVVKRRARREHWDSAVKQGRIAARNMLDQPRAHRAVTYFFSDVFDLTFNAVGEAGDADEEILRGSTANKSFSILHLKDKRLRGALLLERPLNEEKAVGMLILNRIDLSAPPHPLCDESFPLERAACQTVLILQGGGAMGAFECGVVKALEENGIYPDVVAGVSIGAFNAAIVAGNPRQATPALEAFWRDLSIDTPFALTEEMRRALASNYALFFGTPKFFVPRWMDFPSAADLLPSSWTSFYDPTPVLSLIQRYVDFGRLGRSPVRFLASAVDVETARLQIFDSYIDDLTPGHVLASGSLPPGFPWATIGGRHYWDGGLLSNSPLDLVIEQTSLSSKKVYAVNLFPGVNKLPRNIAEVMARRDEILYCEKMAGSLRSRDVIETFRNLVDEIMAVLPPGTADQIRQRPQYIETMGEASNVSVTRIEYQGEQGELASRNYDFSRQTVDRLIAEGYEAAQAAIARDRR